MRQFEAALYAIEPLLDGCQSTVAGYLALHECRHMGFDTTDISLGIEKLIAKPGDIRADRLEGFEKQFVGHVVGHENLHSMIG